MNSSSVFAPTLIALGETFRLDRKLDRFRHSCPQLHSASGAETLFVRPDIRVHRALVTNALCRETQGEKTRRKGKNQCSQRFHLALLPPLCDYS